MIEVKKIEFCGLKNCISVKGGEVELIVTTDIGPRIISYKGYGKDNHMKVFDDHFKDTKSKDFLAYGGHRLWHAPEVDKRTNCADNNACKYEITTTGVTVIAPPDATNIVRGLDININDSGVVVVNHILKNLNMWDIELSIWGLSQLKSQGLLATPNSILNTGLTCNRVVTMWPYSTMNDKRVYWGDKFITVSPDNKAISPFKYGTSVDQGYACFFNDDQLFFKEFAYYYDADYPNQGCNFESYTNSDFIEFETLSPMFTLEAGEEAIHTEYWYLLDGVKQPKNDDEEAILKAVDKLKNHFKLD